MSAGSRKKHSNAHKAFGSGNQDQLEVSAMIAGAGNGRDVEERLGGALKAAGEAQQDQSSAEDALPSAGQPATEVPRGRLARAILSPEALAAAVKVPPPELDLSRGGPIGYTPQYMGRNLLAVVVRNVKLNLFPEGFGDQLKNVIELQAISITGLRTGFVKSAGKLRAEDSEAKYTIAEREGRANDKLLHKWAEKYNSCPTVEERDRMGVAQKQQAITVDDVTIDVMFIEPDVTGKKVDMAWFGKNLHPSWYCGIDSYRDITTTHDDVHLQFILSGDFQRGDHIDTQAQELLAEIIAQPADPLFVKSVRDQIASS